jgi:hypothetical protein
MSMNLFAYLNAAPSLEEMSATLHTLGLVYRHTLPADARWPYPMHVFGGAELRVVYHAGDPVHGEAMIDGRTSQDTEQAQIAVRAALAAIVHQYGGMICDPREVGRGAVL